jgi:cytochrome c-type biogenesis protein CcmH
MMFWIIGGTMIALVTLAVLAPVFWKRSLTSFGGREQAVYADQLVELSHDETTGLISGPEAEAARLEIKKRILKAGREGVAAISVQIPRGRWAIVIAALLVPLLGLGIYGTSGKWWIASVPFSERADERAEAQKFAGIVSALRTRLLEDSEVRVEGWLMLTQTYLRLGKPTEAVWAMERLIERGGAEGRPELMGLYAEALIQSDNGIVSPKAEAALDEVLQVQPDNVAGIYYKAVALEQSGDIAAAFAMLRDRIEKETYQQPWMEFVGNHANSLASRSGNPPVTFPEPQLGPTASDMEAASGMSDADREDFIRSMVARLASRLEQSPEDLDGWIKLANAYKVLGETEKSLVAAEKAGKLAKALPADDPRHEAVANILGLAK